MCPSIDAFLDGFIDRDILCVAGALRPFDFQPTILAIRGFWLAQGYLPRDDFEHQPAFAIKVHRSNMRPGRSLFQSVEGAASRGWPCAKAVRPDRPSPHPPGAPAGFLEFGGHHPANRRDAEPTLNEKPHLMEITGRGFLKKEVPSWAAALRHTNTASCY
jgi:hypothetical protein